MILQPLAPLACAPRLDELTPVAQQTATTAVQRMPDCEVTVPYLAHRTATAGEPTIGLLPPRSGRPLASSRRIAPDTRRIPQERRSGPGSHTARM